MQASNQKEMREELALLCDVAAQAGQIAYDFFGRSPKNWLKDGLSPVSEADLAVDLYLKETLLSARPHYGWISEETLDERKAQNYQRSFIVDPIDGTRGFLNKSPDWCVCIAIIEAGRPICGVLQCPVKGEQFSACATSIARLNGQPLDRQSKQMQQDKPWRLSCSASIAKSLPADLAQRVSLVPDIASLAYRLALLATGQIDVVLVRPNCHDWDIAAVDLILHHSGCCLTNELGEIPTYGTTPFSHGFLIAAPAKIHGQITQYFR